MNIASKSELSKALAQLAREPRNVGAHIQAGVSYSQEKNWEKSIFHLKKALAGDKKNPLILEKLCDVHISARKAPLARKYARRLVDAAKNDSNALYAMARVYEAMGDIAKALHWIDLAIAQFPNAKQKPQTDRKFENMLGDKANYLSEAGEMDKSLEVHRQILKFNPLSANSWWPMAQLQKYEGEQAQKIIEKIEASIQAAKTDEDLRGLHFAAGKVEQDTANYKRAFAHFERANALHDRENTADRIIAAHINFRETYTKDFFHAAHNHGNSSHRPIFILGQTRSGTTLTESLCASHSKVSAGGELPHFSDLNKRMEVFSTFKKGHLGHIHDIKRAKSQELARDIISKTKHITSPGTRLTDKMPHNFLNIGLICLLFPNAQIIHCRRHPMDNCLSIFSNPMLDYHKEYKSRLDVLGKYYHHYVQIMEFWKEVSPIPIYDVYYEDLVTNTQNVARGMIEHLGLDWEDGVMERTGAQKMVKTLSVWQVRQPVFQTSKGKWRNYEKQLEPLTKTLGDYVKKYEAELAALDLNRAE